MRFLSQRSTILPKTPPKKQKQSLRSYGSIIVRAADEMTAEFEAAAKSGASVEVTAAMSSITLKAIGGAAFGVELDTISKSSAARAENSLIVEATNMAIAATTSTLWTALIPPAARPIADPLLRAFPTPRLTKLRTGRSALYTASMALTKNAMKDAGVEFVDEIGMEKAFGAFCFVCQGIGF